MNTNFKYLQKLFFLLVMGFSLCAVQACGSDDESDFNIEGFWYLSSEKWYSYNADGKPNMSDMTMFEEYPYHSDTRIWEITLDANGYYKLHQSEHGFWDEEMSTLIPLGNNSYRKGNDCFTIKSLTSKKMVLEFIDNYFYFFDESGNLLPNDDPYFGVEDGAEFGYYTFIK